MQQKTKSGIKKYSFKDGLPQEFELVEIGQLYNEHSASLTSPHRTGFYHILWFQKGSPTHLVDFIPINIQPNTILFLPKDTVQRFDKNGGFDGKAILFTESFFCKSDIDVKFLRSCILFNDLFTVSKIQISEAPEVFDDIFKLIRTELSNGKDASQADILKNLLHNLLLLSERERRKQDFTELKQSTDLDYVMLFKDLLEADYRKLKQVSDYAKKISVTEKRLNQATSRILDKTPKQMIDARVMLEAKRLLVHTTDSVKEIGFSLGFDEPTNFIKYFRKHSHSTPVEFRELFTLA